MQENSEAVCCWGAGVVLVAVELHSAGPELRALAGGGEQHYWLRCGDSLPRHQHQQQLQVQDPLAS